MGGKTKEEKELVEKVGKLVNKKFGGSYKKAFQHYDRKPKNLEIDRKELIVLLEDADVGNWATRGTWADGIIKKMDKNGNKSIDWGEFEKALKA